MKKMSTTKLISIIIIVAGACIALASDINKEKLMEEEIADEVKKAFDLFVKEQGFGDLTTGD